MESSSRGGKKVLMGRYEVGRLLGKGTFGKVHHARNLETNRSVAIKTVDKQQGKATEVVGGLSEQIKREITAMRLVLSHPNVVELHEVMATRTRIYLVMEYVKGGELFDALERTGRFTEEAAHGYFRQLIGAVEYCHSRGVFHRDLKPENLLVDEHGNLKVSDFGLSALVSSSDSSSNGLLRTACGTPAYVAPEVVFGRSTTGGYDGAKSDVWSCGVVLFVLVAGYLPFRCGGTGGGANNLMEMYRKIQSGEFRCPAWFSPKLKKLLFKILDPNPTTRISIHKIKQSTWFRKGPVVVGSSTKIPAAVGVVNETTTTTTTPNNNAVIVTNAAASSKQQHGTTARLLNNNATTTPVTAHDDVDDDDVKKKPQQRTAAVTSLNAFEIISLSAGLDLSGLFIAEPDHQISKIKETRFTSDKPASAIVSKLQDLARTLNLRVLRKKKGGDDDGGGTVVVKVQARKEGRNGVVRFDAEVFEIAPSYHLVALKHAGGDSLEYRELLERGVRPALQDIVWAWHGDDDPQQRHKQE